jgi:type I restriction enzyme, R subunit
MAGHTETDFEIAIEHGLITHGGFTKGDPKTFDEEIALFPGEVTAFLRASQASRWDAIEKLLGTKTESTVLDTLAKELEAKGSLHVLRHGFRCYGKSFRMAFFQPNSALNPDAAALYAANRLRITRQVAFTSVQKKADGSNWRRVLDVVLSVNGLPVVTVELKNPLTHQRAADAIEQYQNDRDERDLMFRFAKRALVH